VHFTRENTDAVVPSEIEHKIEDVRCDETGDEIDQHYNFMEYHFEIDGIDLRARAYLDDIEVAIILGPFELRSSIKKIDQPKATDRVLSYLRLRFRIVQQS